MKGQRNLGAVLLGLTATVGALLPAPPAAAFVFVIVGTAMPDTIVVDEMLGFWTVNGAMTFFVSAPSNQFTIQSLEGDDVIRVRDFVSNNTYIIVAQQGNDDVAVEDGPGVDRYEIDTGATVVDDPTPGQWHDRVRIVDGPNNFGRQVYEVHTGPGHDDVQIVDSDLLQNASTFADHYIVVLDSGTASAADDSLTVRDAAGLDRYEFDGGPHITGDKAKLSDAAPAEGDLVTIVAFESISGTIS